VVFVDGGCKNISCPGSAGYPSYATTASFVQVLMALFKNMIKKLFLQKFRIMASDAFGL